MAKALSNQVTRGAFTLAAKPRPKVFAIDTGGTMTDTFVVDDDGRFTVGKALTTPQNEADGFLSSLTNGLSYWDLSVEEAFQSIETGVYSGTTMLNRLLERKGSRVGVIVTSGFEDMLVMERGIQTWLAYSYSDRLHVATHVHNEPLVKPNRVRGVRERIDFMGDIVIPLYEEDVGKSVEQLLSAEIDYLVVNLLFSFKNPKHELRVAEIAREVMEKRGLSVPILLSSSYHPIIREFPRLNTITINAYAAEMSREQLRNLHRRVQLLGMHAALRIEASHGGTISIETERLVHTLVSGPIGGVMGAKYLSEKLHIPNIIASDIGGTSFDVSLITDGDFTINPNPSVARFVLNIPMVAVDSIGAGTGSFIRVNPHSRHIEFGPDSAGYKIGICNPNSKLDTPTMTDCDVVLGYVNPDYFLGGDVKLDKQRAVKGIGEQIAEPLGIDVYEAAEGAIEILEHSLRNYVESMVLGRGYETVNYVLLSYGGGGPLHVGRFSMGLKFQDIIIPEWAAAFSAFGCACGDFEYRYDKTVGIAVPPDASEDQKTIVATQLTDAWRQLTDIILSEFSKSGIEKDAITFKPSVRAKYAGQFGDIEVRSPRQVLKDSRDVDELLGRFDSLYAKLYTKAASAPELGYEITSAFMIGSAETKKPRLMNKPLESVRPPDEALKATRGIYSKGKWFEASIYEMGKLNPGNKIDGPSIIEAPATTLVVPTGRNAYLDEARIFHLK